VGQFEKDEKIAVAADAIAAAAFNHPILRSAILLYGSDPTPSGKRTRAAANHRPADTIPKTTVAHFIL
jgi:hypothetical protein